MTAWCDTRHDGRPICICTAARAKQKTVRLVEGQVLQARLCAYIPTCKCWLTSQLLLHVAVLVVIHKPLTASMYMGQGSLPFPSLPFPSLPFPSLPFPSLPFPSLPFPVQEIRSLLVQEFKKLWTEMKRITSDSNLSDGRKKTLRDVQLQRLYCATGEAKIKGAVEQIEAALAEGGSPSRMQGHMAFSSLMRSNESQHCT